MKFSIVIPTMPRKDVGYKYMLESLPYNLKVFKVVGIEEIYLYMNPADAGLFAPICEKENIKLNIIPIISHPQNTHTDYNFWIRNLVFDAQYCINELARLTDAEYLVRLEDDVVFYRSTFNHITKKKTYRTLVGALGLFLFRQDLAEFNDVINANSCAEYFKPLDWLPLAKSVELIHPNNYEHIGEMSSGGMMRNDAVKITNIRKK